MVGQASCLPFVTPDFDPGSSLDARVRGHDDRQSRLGVTVPLKTRCHLFESESVERVHRILREPGRFTALP